MPYKAAKGFTLIELLIGMTILSVTLMLVVPSATDYFRNAKIRRVADEMHIGLELAKAEAIKRNGSIRFNVNTTGWDVRVLGAGGAPDTVIMDRQAEGSESDVQTAASSNTLDFNSRGRATPNNFVLNITNPGGGACKDAGGDMRCLRIMISPAGQVNLCDPALASGDPRACS